MMVTPQRRAALVGAISHFTDKVTSHKAGPAFVYVDQLQRTGDFETVDWCPDDLSGYTDVFVYQADNGTSTDTPETLNLFGGMENKDYAVHANRLSAFKGPVKILNAPPADYAGMFRKRYDKSATEKVNPLWHSLDWNAYEDFWKRSQVLKWIQVTDRMVIGDSHAISLYSPGYMVQSIPFKTLNGALKSGLKSFLVPGLRTVDFYFGNIDIRHHLCRLPGDPLENTTDLAKRYIAQAKSLIGHDGIRSVSIYEPLPIENESRVLPKTGYYKGKPFWGTWEERNRVREQFIKVIDSEFGINRWTDRYKNSDGELDFAYMEKPRSVHLAPASYPFFTVGDKPFTSPPPSTDLMGFFA